MRLDDTTARAARRAAPEPTRLPSGERPATPPAEGPT